MQITKLGIITILALALGATSALAQPGPNGKNNYGQCKAYFAGSEEGRTNKQAAPPFQALVTAAIDEVVDESCGAMAGCMSDDQCECIESNNSCNDTDCPDPDNQCGAAAGCAEGQCECDESNNSCNDTREACEEELCGGEQQDECVAESCPDSNPAGRGKNPSDGSPGQQG